MPRTRSYNMSQSLNGLVWTGNIDSLAGIPTFKNLTDIRDPETDRCMVFVEVLRRASGLTVRHSHPRAKLGRASGFDLPPIAKVREWRFRSPMATLNTGDGKFRSSFVTWGNELIPAEMEDYRRVQAAIKTSCRKAVRKSGDEFGFVFTSPLRHEKTS